MALVFSAFAISSVDFVGQNGVSHKGIGAARSLSEVKNMYKGYITTKVVHDVILKDKLLNEKYNYAGDGTVPDKIYAKSLQSQNDIEDMTNQIICGDGEFDPYALLKISSKQSNSIYALREANIQGYINKYGKTKEQKKFLKVQYQKNKTPFYYEAADSWKTMYLYAETYSLVLIVLIGFLASGIFADEFKLQADAIFFSTKYGRTKAVRSKIASGIIMSTIVYWMGIGLLSAISFAVMGIGGAGVTTLVGETYQIYSVSFMQEYLIIVLCGYIASILSASVAMLVSAKLHSSSIAVCIPFLLFCVSPFIGRVLPFKTCFYLTPDQLVNVMNCIKIPLIYQFGNVVFRQIPFITILYLLISIGLLPLIYQSYHRYAK